MGPVLQALDQIARYDGNALRQTRASAARRTEVNRDHLMVGLVDLFADDAIVPLEPFPLSLAHERDEKER